MTFLQPFMLWGLPLVLLPVVIHLLNRMRYRSQPWGAMRLLLSATRRSISQAKLRQFLVLLFRVLAVAMLVLFLSRPIAGGWLGWAFSAAPDVVFILLDRSASMEARVPGTTQTRREQALRLVAQAAKPFEGASRFVLVESAQRAPQEIAGVGSLAELSLCAPTDSAADIPAMLQSALNWLLDNRAGAAEIWIASDLQRSNWQPNDARFKTVLAQLGALPSRRGGIRVRLLALNQPLELNSSVRIEEALRRQRGDAGEIQFVLDLQCNTGSSGSFPLTLVLDGAASQLDVSMDGQMMRWRHRVVLGNKKSGGSGSFQLPADANLRDNTAYFVYGDAAPLRAVVVAADAQNGRLLKLAAAAIGGEPVSAGRVFTPDNAASAPLAEAGLLIWQGPLPNDAVAEQVLAFVVEGSVVLFLPPGANDAGSFNGISWGDVQSAEAGKFFRVARWDELQGPLAKTDEGLSLPVGEVDFLRRQRVVGQRNALAAFSDAESFLVRQTVGKGEVYFCASLPSAEWSSLADGTVLIPMLQRLMQSGSRRLQQVGSVSCGELNAADRNKPWSCVDSTAGKNVQFDAGVYRSGERLLAVNRPVAEDEPETLDETEARALFTGLPFQLWAERGGENYILQREVWRLFVFSMLVFLLVEGFLILPAAARPGLPARAARSSGFNRPGPPEGGTPNQQSPVTKAAIVQSLIWCVALGVSLQLGAWHLESFT